MTNLNITLQPRIEPRVVTEKRPRHIFSWEDRSPAAEPLSRAPIGFCGRRVEVAGVNSAVEVEFLLRHRGVNAYRIEHGLQLYDIGLDEVCPACDAALEQGVAADRFANISAAIAMPDPLVMPSWHFRSGGWQARRLAS